jgi:uncharacterized membrane protein
VSCIIGLVMSCGYRAEAREWVKTHYRFQSRTFWIGLLYGSLSLLTAIIVVGSSSVYLLLSGGLSEALRY